MDVQRAMVKRFVRDTLGCECPDEVFRRIDIDRQATLGGEAATRIVIGESEPPCTIALLQMLVRIWARWPVSNRSDGFSASMSSSKVSGLASPDRLLYL